MIDTTLIGKTIDRTYIAKADDKHILLFCTDKSFYSIHYPINHCEDPRYFSSSVGLAFLLGGVVSSIVEDFTIIGLPAGAIGSIGATITTNLGSTTFNSVVSEWGCNVSGSFVSDIEEYDGQQVVRNVLVSPTNLRDYTEFLYDRLLVDF